MNTKSFDILLIEDDIGDVELTEAVLADSNLKINLNVVNDGEEALAYLRQEGQYTKAVLPNLILLDLNLPGISGLEFLSTIRSDNRFKVIPVVILTTSDANADISNSYKLGANCYITKAMGLKDFVKKINSIQDFWLTVVQLPYPENHP